MKKTIISKSKQKSISKIKVIMLFITLISFYCTNTYSQQRTDKIHDSIFSKAQNEYRKLQIVLPEGYESSSDQKYDVIYAVDGEWNTDMITQIHDWTSGWNFMPKNIIVGIENKYINGVNQRNRDLTPTQNNAQPLSGKADNFLDFIKEELIPYINENYLTTGDNTLFGHSHGGTFTLYALLKEPQLFKSYISTDPSLWWDNRYMSKYAAERLPDLSNINATLHISGRQGGAYEGMGIVAMDSVLKQKAPKGLIWKTVDYPNEIHNSVRFKGIYEGLKLAYAGFTNEEIGIHPMAGIVEKGKPYNVLLDSELKSIHYTTDGTEPTTSSPIMGESITLNEPVEFKAKPVSLRHEGKTITVNFKEGNAFKPKNKPKKYVTGGWNYKYYEGSWNKMPDFKKLKPVKTGVANQNFNLSDLPESENFACVFEGYIEIKEDGHHAFGIAADDGAKFYINNQLILNHDFSNSGESFKSFVVPLKKGFYPVKLEYFQKKGNRRYILVYLTPGTTNALPIPFDIQYHKE